MRLHGYLNSEELAEALFCNEEWIITQLREFGAPEIIIQGSPHWLDRDVEQFMRKRQKELHDHQQLRADLLREAIRPER